MPYLEEHFLEVQFLLSWYFKFSQEDIHLHFYSHLLDS